MDQDQNQNRQQPGQEPQPGQTPIKPTRPTTADLYNAWKTGGKAKLMETLPGEPDPEDEE